MMNEASLPSAPSAPVPPTSLAVPPIPASSTANPEQLLRDAGQEAAKAVQLDAAGIEKRQAIESYRKSSVLLTKVLDAWSQQPVVDATQEQQRSSIVSSKISQYNQRANV